MATDRYSPWRQKPWWCQPWTILLTGTSLMGGSWWLLHRWWLTLLISLPLLAWMGFFLLIWPRLMAAAYADSPAPEIPPPMDG